MEAEEIKGCEHLGFIHRCGPCIKRDIHEAEQRGMDAQQAKIDEMVKVLVKLRPFIAAYEASAQEEIYGEMIDDALKLARGK